MAKKTSAKTANSKKYKNILITGGAGFIGINLARHFLVKGQHVIIFDNLSRKGTDVNIRLLKRDFGTKFTLIKADIVTDFAKLKNAVAKADAVVHLAAQVAVTTSVDNPRHDFEVNAIGSFNVVEAIRLSKNRPPLIYSSTNKVYGSLHHRPVREHDTHYRFEHDEIHANGISESEQLDFHSPYGCSKGIADQYVIDYSRVYGLKTVVFRQSCIYGPYQFGVEDQGWVAWFGIAAMFGKQITVYGNGKQVRDILYINDLVRLYDLALTNIDKVSGHAYNVGGGPTNTLSLIKLLEMLEKRLGFKIPTLRADIRVGDQPVFVADIRKVKSHLGWSPEHGVDFGFDQMMNWIEEHQELIKKALQ
jgi:CDP-paratose 2-epimerase